MQQRPINFALQIRMANSLCKRLPRLRSCSVSGILADHRFAKTAKFKKIAKCAKPPQHSYFFPCILFRKRNGNYAFFHFEHFALLLNSLALFFPFSPFDSFHPFAFVYYFFFFHYTVLRAF